MNLSHRILGAYVVDALTKKAAAPVLVVGSDVFRRHDFATIDCFNFIAAANLSKVLRDVGVKNLRDLFERLPPSSLLLPHLGPVSVAVLGAAFELKGIGGPSPLEAWMQFHSGPDAPLATFGTLKHRAKVREQASRARSRSRARSIRRRQTSAHSPAAAYH